MTQQSASPPRVEAMALDRRSLAPDLARGFMLLVIATVHAHLFRVFGSGEESPLSHEGMLDTGTNVFMTMFAESRGYPMFALLFGYGLTWIYLRRSAEGHSWPWVRSLVRRRGLWLIVIGLLHSLLLFYGDIIAVYGFVAVLFAGLLHVTDRRLLAHGFTWMALGSLFYAVATAAGQIFGGDSEPLPAVQDYLSDIIVRVVMMPVMMPMMLPVMVFPFAVGVWAARRRLLEEPEKHLVLLRRTAFVGIPVAALGGLPNGLMLAELWTPGALGVLGSTWLHMLSGYLGGFGYAALIALIAVRLSHRRGPIVRALVATGQRSMTCYLLQSVAWLVLFMPYTFDVTGRLSDFQAVLVGVVVWAVTVVLADLMRRAGMRGPAEAFLRNRTYARARRVPS